MIVYENYLKPVLSSQKSYYRKARIETFNQVKNLYSYDILMVGVENDEVIYLNDDEACYTHTTLKHVKDFLYQCLGYKDISKLDILQKICVLNSSGTNTPKIPGAIEGL